MVTYSHARKESSYTNVCSLNGFNILYTTIFIDCKMANANVGLKCIIVVEELTYN